MKKMPRINPFRVVLATLGLALAIPAIATAAPEISPHCTAAPYRQLDFWIGDWDTFETDTPDGASIARARVKPIAQGCAIHELYEQNDGLIGDSILSYDPVRKQWQQTWVTNRGSIMVLWGNLKDGALVLEGDVHLKNGTSTKQRITWKTHYVDPSRQGVTQLSPEGTSADVSSHVLRTWTQGNAVRESAELSRDGGKTWVPAFDVLFRRRSAQQK
jgi:hypothetical protein